MDSARNGGIVFLFLACLTALVGLVALAGVSLGVAAITCGWVLPKIRPVVERPRVYGWGALLMALGVFLMGGVIELFTDPIPGLVPPAGLGPLFLGSMVVRASRRPEVADVQGVDKP
ncbi:hypothetical protein AB0D33_09475 [Streptomyces sp. NPDC048404]|uniref:hypothetical protein n=1 Tax=unclassified Streptomyces TaxID=2593676 RepID=UPI0034236D86